MGLHTTRLLSSGLAGLPPRVTLVSPAVSHETIAPFAPLRGAGVERTGLNVFAVSGCVLAVFVGGDHGQQSLLRRSRIQVRPRHERLIRGGMHDLTARVTRIAVFKFQLNRAIKRNER